MRYRVAKPGHRTHAPQQEKLRSQRSHTSTPKDLKNPASLCRRGLPLALRLARGGKAASEALNIGDG